MIFAASSESGSAQNLSARIRHAAAFSARTRWRSTVFNIDPLQKMYKLTNIMISYVNYKLQRHWYDCLARAYLKYCTLVCSRFRRPSNSKSGSALFKNKTSTSTSSRAGWKKSARNVWNQWKHWVLILVGICFLKLFWKTL